MSTAPAIHNITIAPELTDILTTTIDIRGNNFLQIAHIDIVDIHGKKVMPTAVSASPVYTAVRTKPASDVFTSDSRADNFPHMYHSESNNGSYMTITVPSRQINSITIYNRLDSVCENGKPCSYRLASFTLTAKNAAGDTVAKTQLTGDFVQTIQFNYLKGKHDNIQVLRQELDSKLAELYAVDNSVYTENKMAHDATIYSGLLLTVLATSILFFAFSKI
jgi:hypothetical protein